jgi:hypothetical protein
MLSTQERLPLAAAAGSIPSMEALIRAGANIHYNDEEAALFAACGNQVASLKYLIEKGADIHIHNDRIFCMAAENDCLDVVKFLVEEQHVDIHTLNNRALERSKYYSATKVVEYLESLMMRTSVSTPRNNDGRSECFWCSGVKTQKRGGGAYDVCPKCQR